MAMPGAVMLVLEAGAFETSTILVGYLGDINTLDAHFVMLSLCGISFVALPLSVSIAGSIRVGSLLGSNDPKRANLAGWICIALGVGFVSCTAIVLAVFRNLLGYIFTNDEVVVEIVSKVAVIAACFQLVDGIQGTSAGVLRGCGRQTLVAFTNFLGFWVLGLPVGALLAFECGLGVYGVWWGITLGLTVAAIVSIFLLNRVNWAEEARLAALRVTESGLSHDHGSEGESLSREGLRSNGIDSNHRVQGRQGGFALLEMKDENDDDDDDQIHDIELDVHMNSLDTTNNISRDQDEHHGASDTAEDSEELIINNSTYSTESHRLNVTGVNSDNVAVDHVNVLASDVTDRSLIDDNDDDSESEAFVHSFDNI